MNLKEKLAALRQAAKSALDEAEKLIGDGKFDEAKAKQAEAKTAREQAEVVAAQIQAAEADELQAAKAEIARLQAEADKPVRPPFGDPAPEPKDDEGIKAFTLLKYGEVEPAVKAVLGDLYGQKTGYNEMRYQQMAAFVKYVRFGDARLTAREAELLHPSAQTIILRPEVIKAEIMAGRTVAEIKATLIEGSNELGGYLVPEDYRFEIIKRLMGMVVVRQRARVITTVRDRVQFPRLEGGDSRYTSAVRVTWVPETPSNANVANTNPTWGMQDIPIHTVMARTNLSRNNLEDSAFSLLEIMADLFSEAMALDEDAMFLTGAGGNAPQGVLGDRANGTNATPVAGIQVANTGDAAAITYDGLIDLFYLLDAQYRDNAVVVQSKTTARTERKLKDGEGRPLWQPGLAAGQPATLNGYGIAESEAMPAIGANNHPIIFGDFRRGYVIADRVGMTIERVSDTTTVGQNQVALFARRRLGGQVVAPWAFVAQKCSA